MLRAIFRLCTVLTTLFAFLPTASHAQNSIAGVAPQQAGFPASPPNSTFMRQSAVIAEIVPSSPGKEIAIGSQEGYLSVLSSGGQLIWQQQVPPSLCASSANRLQSNPAVGALDGDGVPSIVIGYGSIYTKGDPNYCPGGVAAFDGRNGNLKWRIDLGQQSPDEALSGVVSTPALADVDGNGTLEVAFGGFDRNMYLVDNAGNRIWRFHAADTIWSSPVFANVNSDSRLEVIFTTDIKVNSTYKTTNGGFVYAFRTTPSAQPNRVIPFSPTPANIENLIWRSPNYEQVMYSSPAYGDVNGDGAPELVFSSGCFYPRGTSAKVGRWIKILNPTNGAEIRTINLPFCSRSSPALGDLDSDGTLDIAIATTGETGVGGDGACHIGAWRGDGSQLWLVTPTLFGTFSDPGCDNIQAPSIADVDGNGSLEVLTTNGLGVVALNGANGAQLTDQNPPTMSIPNQGIGTNSMPVVGDLDNNGVYEVVIGGLNSVYVWTNLAGAISSPVNPNGRPNSAPWPMFHGNALRNGQVAPDPTLRIVSNTFGAVVQANSGRVSGTINFVPEGGSSFRWNASEDIPWLTLGSTSGTTPEGLTVNFNPNAVDNDVGVYEGTITISSPDGVVGFLNDSSVGSSRSIQVRLVVTNQVYPQFLPIVLR